MKNKRKHIIIRKDRHSYLNRDISFLLWSTKRSKSGCRGRCDKFHHEPECDGAIWYQEGDVLALLHECVHLAHHLLAMRCFKVTSTMLSAYDELGHPSISKEEKLCHLIALIQHECLLAEGILSA